MPSFPNSRFSMALFGASLVSVLVFSGCGSPAVPGASGTPSANQPNSGEGAAIPAEFPADILRYPGATVLFAFQDAQPGAYSISQETADDVATANARLDRFFQDQGFQKANANGDQAVTYADYQKGRVRLHAQVARDATRDVTKILLNRMEMAP